MRSGGVARIVASALLVAATASCSEQPKSVGPDTSAHDAVDAGCSVSPCIPVLATPGLDPTSLAVDDAYVYFTTVNQGAGATGGIVAKVPTHGGAVVTLASRPGAPGSLVIDAGELFWSELDDTTLHVLSVGVGGGSVSTLVSAAPMPDSAFDEAGGVAVDSSNVYVSACEAGFGSACSFPDCTGLLLRAPRSGGVATPIYSGAGCPLAMAVGGSSVYWTVYGSASVFGRVMRAPVDGGPAQTLAAGQESPWSIAVDATKLYWANAALPAGTTPEGAVHAWPVTGGPIDTIAAPWNAPSNVMLDESNVYWFGPVLGSVDWCHARS
jgi:hypothetical protein